MSIAKTGPVWVEWWPAEEPHGHLLTISTPGEIIDDVWTNIEAWATELADAVAMCNEERHKGHGKTHTQDQVNEAYRIAITQLLTVDYDTEWEEMGRRERRWKKWGGPVPEAVIFPDHQDPRENHLLLTDREGNPHIYPLRQGMKDIIPPPSEKTAYRDKMGISWYRKSIKKKNRRRGG